ncbi:Ribosomal protein SA [Spironucleus salmonicida]|uniref:Small ribosomal subunit protein uS2 n=1 Tax=Spironucleus salmonicida TaxID=348837 RepID=V6LCN2_9EUKA|nr:Ribosomal protein SA [Spironucleus salmonicida]|eukprot:EST42240.1 Ribosomal protein SA [Spironucleus salmonicida]
MSNNLQKEDVIKMIIANTHLGHRNMDKKLAYYIHSREKDGTYIFNLDKTWQKIQLAARMITAVADPSRIAVVAGRPEAHRAVHKFCRFIRSQGYAGRYQPGTFTNRLAPKYFEPELLIIADPTIDHQALAESSYCNVPVISLCNSDSKLSFVDCAIPCNNKAKNSVGLMFWMLAREVLIMKGTIKREDEWQLPDIFIALDEKTMDAMVKEEQVEGDVAPATADFAE